MSDLSFRTPRFPNETKREFWRRIPIGKYYWHQKHIVFIKTIDVSVDGDDWLIDLDFVKRQPESKWETVDKTRETLKQLREKR